MAVLVLLGKGVQEVEAGGAVVGKKVVNRGHMSHGSPTNCPVEAEEMASPHPREPGSACTAEGRGGAGWGDDARSRSYR